MSNSVLLCISTLLDSGNHYSKMFDLVDSVGRKLFESISITLVCEDCMQTEHPEKCTHKLAEMPRWLSSQKMETVKQLLADDPAMLLRESMGVGADGSTKAFPSKDVDALVDPKRRAKIHRDPTEYHGWMNANHFCLAVDPAGGGSSAFAVCSMVQMHTGQIIVLGVDLLRTKDVRTTHRLVVDHIARVRTVSGMENATCVLQLESNLAFECQHIIHALTAAGVKKWIALSEGQGGTIGWLTTHDRKEAMCFQMRDALRVGCLYLSEEFFSVLMEEREALKAVRDELCRFAIVTEPAKTLFGKIRKTYTGKLGGLQDDLAIVMQLCITGLRCFYQSDKYQTFRPEL